MGPEPGSGFFSCRADHNDPPPRVLLVIYFASSSARGGVLMERRGPSGCSRVAVDFLALVGFARPRSPTAAAVTS